MTYCYLNGQIIQQTEARLGINDLTLLRGYGIFDYFLFKNQQPRFLEDYINRFLRSAAHLRLTLPINKPELRQAIHDLIKANNLEQGGIRLVLTGGYSDNGFSPTLGNFFILQYPLPAPPPIQYIEGASIATLQLQRELPEVKSLNYLTGIKILPWLVEQKADYPLYHDGTYLRESDRSNFFIVGPEGQLITPATKVLGGITRSKVIDIAKAHNLPLEVREVGIGELATAKEAMLTSSIKGVLPITMIDRKIVADGKPGPISQFLQSEYVALLQEHEYQK